MLSGCGMWVYDVVCCFALCILYVAYGYVMMCVDVACWADALYFIVSYCVFIRCMLCFRTP